jgi:hypothetical protein
VPGFARGVTPGLDHAKGPLPSSAAARHAVLTACRAGFGRPGGPSVRDGDLDTRWRCSSGTRRGSLRYCSSASRIVGRRAPANLRAIIVAVATTVAEDLLDETGFGIHLRKEAADVVLQFGRGRWLAVRPRRRESVAGVGPGDPREVVLSPPTWSLPDIELFPVDDQAQRRRRPIRGILRPCRPVTHRRELRGP